MKYVSSKKTSSDTIAGLNSLGKPVALVFLSALLTGIIFGNRTNLVVGPTSDDWFSCAPNGNAVFPWQKPAGLDWDSSYLLSVTIGFGKFTFSQAKALDICWDLLVGRGGQALLAITTYPILRRSLLLCMERSSMHLPVVTSIAFDQIRACTLLAVVRDLMIRFDWRLLAFLQILAYILSFGTMVSAMTAYQVQAAPWFPESSTGNLIRASEIQVTSSLRIADGDRIGLEPNAQVDSNAGVDYDLLARYGSVVNGTEPPTDDTTQTSGVASYQNDHDEASFRVVWSRTGDDGVYFSNSTIILGHHTYVLEDPPMHILVVPQSYSFSGSALQSDWLAENVVCQPLQTYQWGFSSILLFVFCIMTILFNCALLAVSSEVWMRSRTDRYKYRHSKYRDILDLAEEIKCEVGDEAYDMTPEELNERFGVKVGRVRIDIDDLPLSRSLELDEKASSKRLGLENKATERHVAFLHKP